MTVLVLLINNISPTVKEVHEDVCLQMAIQSRVTEVSG